MSRRLPDPPPQLLAETRDLLDTLNQTVANLREFTERLSRATEHTEHEPEEATP